jgi:hypothetical protein
MEQKNSLILDKEFLDYCKLNNIEDVEGLARKVFKQGFDILKYNYFQPLVKTQEQADKFMEELNRAVQTPISSRPSPMPAPQKTDYPAPPPIPKSRIEISFSVSP